MATAVGRFTRTGSTTALGRYTRIPLPTPLTLTIAPTSHATSQMEIGLSHIDEGTQGSSVAKNRAKSIVAESVTWYNSHIYQFGAGVIMEWTGDGSPSGPNGTYLREEIVGGIPTEVTLTNRFDDNLQQGVDAGGQHVITFFGVPWFLRGSTTFVSGSVAGGDLVQEFEPGNSGWEWGGDASKGRLRTDSIDTWQELVRDICRATMPARHATNAPYGVSARVFQVGNEFKGFTSRTRDNRGQAHDFDDYPGTEGQADMSYTAFYKLTVEAILDVATELGIAHSEIKVGGPYPVNSAKGLSSADAITANRTDSTGATVDYSQLIGRSYGYWNKAAFEDIDEFLLLAQTQGFKVDFLAMDVSTFLQDRETQNPDDFYVAYYRYHDSIAWVRQRLVARGFPADFPVVMSEWYTKPQVGVGTTGQTVYYAALQAVTYMVFAQQGVWIPLRWGPWGDGLQVHTYADGTEADFDDPGKYQGGLVSLITSATEGGERQEASNVERIFADHFGPGTALYAVTASDESKAIALATPGVCTVVNKQNAALPVRIVDSNGFTLATDTLTPYETKAVEI